jgi:hypothetical protein
MTKNILHQRVGSRFVDKGGEVIRVSNAFIHPNYDENVGIDFDFALLQLSLPIVFSDTKKPIALADANDIFKDGTPVLISGWGKTDFNDQYSSDTLRAEYVYIFNIDRCKAIYNEFAFPGEEIVTSNMICAIAPGRNSCQGLVEFRTVIGLTFT